MDIRTRVGHVLNFLGNQKYALDVYQRGYVWTDREIRKFLTDLEDHAVDWIADPHNAPPWFLGTVILERRADINYLVDGQQRVVTLGLLLLALHPRADRAHKTDIELALSSEGARLSLPVAVGRYQLAFSALARGKGPDAFADRDEDQQRIATAFFRIKDWLDTVVRPEDLPLLIEGLLRRCLLNIVTVSDTELAYRLFNSLNSRGKPLSTIEALKSVLLADLDPPKREAFAAAWDRARADADAGGGDPTITALQSALIARAAPASLEVSAFAASPDVKAIRENPFHWLTGDGDNRPPPEQVARELPFFITLNARMDKVAHTPTSGADALHFITAVGLPVDQWAPIVMAPLSPVYSEADDNARKAAAAVAFLDIAAARLVWRGRGVTPAQTRDLLAGLAPHLRDSDPEGVALRLAALLEGHFPDPFRADAPMRVGADSLDRDTAHALLARLTAFAETFAARPAGDYAHFAQGGAGGFGLASALAPAEEALVAGLPGPPGPDPAAEERLGALVLAPEAARRTLETAPPPEWFALMAKAGGLLGRAVATKDGRVSKTLQPLLEAFDAPLGPVATAADADHRERFFTDLARDIWATGRILDAAADPPNRLIAALGFANA